MNEHVNNLFGFFDQKKCQIKKGKAVKKNYETNWLQKNSVL